MNLTFTQSLGDIGVPQLNGTTMQFLDFYCLYAYLKGFRRPIWPPTWQRWLLQMH